MESYQQKETKVKYSVQFGIAPYKKNDINEIYVVSFCFTFDESTSSQIKKQYDGYFLVKK